LAKSTVVKKAGSARQRSDGAKKAQSKTARQHDRLGRIVLVAASIGIAFSVLLWLYTAFVQPKVVPHAFNGLFDKVAVSPDHQYVVALGHTELPARDANSILRRYRNELFISTDYGISFRRLKVFPGKNLRVADWDIDWLRGDLLLTGINLDDNNGFLYHLSMPDSAWTDYSSAILGAIGQAIEGQQVARPGTDSLNSVANHAPHPMQGRPGDWVAAYAPLPPQKGEQKEQSSPFNTKQQDVPATKVPETDPLQNFEQEESKAADAQQQPGTNRNRNRIPVLSQIGREGQNRDTLVAFQGVYLPARKQFLGAYRPFLFTQTAGGLTPYYRDARQQDALESELSSYSGQNGIAYNYNAGTRNFYGAYFYFRQTPGATPTIQFRSVTDLLLDAANVDPANSLFVGVNVPEGIDIIAFQGKENYKIGAGKNGYYYVWAKNQQNATKGFKQLYEPDDYYEEQQPTITHVAINESGQGLMFNDRGILYHLSYDPELEEYDWYYDIPGDSLGLKVTGLDLQGSNAWLSAIPQNSNQGILLKSQDAGETWQDAPVLKSYPNDGFSNSFYWVYVLTWLASLFLVPVGLVLRSNARKKWGQLETTVIKESPLALLNAHPAEQDRLNFKDTVGAVLRLLKNPDTNPPINIVLNGQWGSGKSSMMLQIRKALDQDSRFVTMWFNIWHYQQENELLTVFLNRLLNRLEQHFGFGYRYNLFRNRVRNLTLIGKLRFWFSIGILAPIAVCLLLYILPYKPENYLKELPVVNQLYAAIMHFIRAILSGDIKDSDYGNLWLVGSIFTLIISLLSLRLEWVSSGIGSFFSLLPLNIFKKKTIEGDPGQREKYKKEFWELFRAAHKNTRFVVFIDDLDRVDGKKAKELLETINFIADTASKPDNLGEAPRNSNIFFVLGVSLEEVTRSMNQIMEKRDDLDDPASRYIEKVVDLVVQVPSLRNVDQQKLVDMISRGADEAAQGLLTDEEAPLQAPNNSNASKPGQPTMLPDNKD